MVDAQKFPDGGTALDGSKCIQGKGGPRITTKEDPDVEAHSSMCHSLFLYAQEECEKGVCAAIQRESVDYNNTML